MDSWKMLTYDFPNYDELILIGLADLHIGSPQFNEKKFMQFVLKWGSKPNVRFVLAGDLIDNGLKHSKTECLYASMSPRDQIKRVAQLLEPIRTKILCITDGNHEHRTEKETTIPPGELLAYELGLNSVFCHDATCYLKISVGKRKNGRVKMPIYSVAVHHGSSKAKLKKHAPVIGCDLLIVGHTHTPDYFPVERFEVDLIKGLVGLKRTRVLTLTAWLDYGGYGEEAMYQPCSIAPNRAVLFGGEHCIETVGT